MFTVNFTVEYGKIYSRKKYIQNRLYVIFTVAKVKRTVIFNFKNILTVKLTVTNSNIDCKIVKMP